MNDNSSHTPKAAPAFSAPYPAPQAPQASQASWADIIPENIPTPCFVVDEDRLSANLAVLGNVKQRTGAKILLALKGFAMFSTFPLLRETLDGVCASSPHEARLGREEFGKEVHAFAAAYSDADMQDILKVADHIVFNSFAQFNRFIPEIKKAALAQNRTIEAGLRLNPEHSEGAVPIYDPCSPGSRLGIRKSAFDHLEATNKTALDAIMARISGLHFHTLCEQDAAPLARTLAVIEQKFHSHFPNINWLNFGGGHHITRPGYDIDLLCDRITHIKKTYNLNVYLEPGEAVALNAGILVSTVLDVITADMPIAILDTSAAAHMPDVLEMPYRPEVINAAPPHQKAHTVRLAGKSCLAGDVIGEYSFDTLPKPGDKLIFLDMAHYSMVKTNTFNGLTLPSLALTNKKANFRLIKNFTYENFKNRLS